MRFRVRDLDPSGKFLPQLRLELLARVIPRDLVQAVLRETGRVTQRERKLNLEVTLWFVIAMNLFASLALPEVFEKLAHGLRLLWSDDAERQERLPNKSALCYRRYQLGVLPLRRLFERFCRPLATPQTQGAFLGGLRLMALDGYTEDVPDTPENDRVFGRPHSDRGASAFPQVRCVTLCELGTHAAVDAVFLPYRQGEVRGARRLLRSLKPGMLLLWDRGFHGYELFRAVHQQRVAVLGRLPSGIQPVLQRRLSDGSALVHLQPADGKRRQAGEHLVLRLLEYTLTDPALPGYGTRYRLLTTLLDARCFPAATLAATYHERWEMELFIDETDTHLLGQHQPSSPLRSRKPQGVIQELYGLLLAHYAIRVLMHEAALKAEVSPDRLSFTHALEVIRASLPDFEIADARLFPGLHRRLLQDLVRPLLPERRPREVPRAVRRKVIKWPLKRWEHRGSPQPTRPYTESIHIFEAPERVLI